MEDLQKLRSRLSPKKQAILQQRLRGEGARGPRVGGIPRRPQGEPPRLSFAQERLWFLDQLAPGSAAYNIVAGMRFDGALDLAAVDVTLREIVRRHETLRTTFHGGSGQPVPVIAPAPPWRTPLVDLGGLPPAAREPEAARLALAEDRRPFDLERGPLLRVVLLRLEENEHVALLAMHHIVSDGWSIGVFVRELGELYRAAVAGAPSPLPELPIQYADFAAWQRQWLQGPVLQSQLAFWRERLGGELPVLDLATDRPRPAIPSPRGEIESVFLPESLRGALDALGRGRDATPFMVLAAAIEALLHRHTGQEDLLLGFPIANRRRAETEPLIGLFVNTLVLRTDLSGDPDLSVLLARVRAGTLGAYEHQDLPFEKLVEELQPARSLDRSPVFQTMVVFENAPLQPLALPALQLRPYLPRLGRAQFDLTWIFLDLDGGLEVVLDYDAGLFDRTTVRRLLDGFSRLLAGMVAAPGLRLSELPLSGESERHQLVREWNDTAAGAPFDIGLHELVSEQARRAPEALAAVYEGESLTYEELDRRATALALHLVDLGVPVDGRVGVLAERSLEMIVGLLGVLKAGAAYVPLDPGYPAERLALLSESAGLSVVLAQARLTSRLPRRGERVVVLDEPVPAVSPTRPLPSVAGQNLAYALYTSGSTGTPKGVMIPHRGIVNRLVWMQEAYGLTAADRVLQKTPFSFDVSLWEFFWPLLVGARLVFARPEGHKDPAYLADLMVREGITTLHFVPSMLQVFLEEPDLPAMPSLRQVMASGEALPPDLVRRFYARIGNARLHNLYGPTEASVDVSFWACGPDASRVPIGRPIHNLSLYVADRQLGLQPLGVPGELLLGGVGLARGYLGRPDLTAAAFVPDPFGEEPGERLYRTGDLARTLPDGAVEYLGRIDHQVKIRGVRIEPGEIEALLASLPGAAAAAVVVPPASAQARRLVAFVVPQPGAAADLAALRRQLQAQVPEAMVPAAWLVVDALPLTSSGKVDRRSLVRLAQESGPAPGAGPAVAPRTQAEEILAGIWSEVLGRDGIGVLDDFFELGGHSLLATRVMSRIRQAFGVDLPLRQLFQAPTLAGLAARVEAERSLGGSAEPPPLVVVPRDGGLPLSFAQERLWFLDQLEPGSPAYNIPAAVRLTGVLDEAVLERCLGEVVRRHETLRTTFEVDEGRPVQRIRPPGSWRLPVVDLSALAEAPRSAEARRLAREEALRPFDLARGPLLRASLLRDTPGRRVLLLTLHHVISDGWSMGVLIGEIAALYPALVRGERSPLPELPVQYADFAVWQRGWLSGVVLERQSVFWRQSLAGAPEALELSADRPRPAVQSFRGAQARFEVPAARAARLRELARAESATPFMVLSAAFAALLGRWSGQDEVVLGTAVANRTRPEIEGLIGFFVNILALRHDLREDPSFLELVARARTVALGAFAHQDLPFEKVVEEVQLRRDPSRPPLFQVLLVLQNTPAPWPDLPEIAVEAMAVDGDSAKFDLTLALAEAGDGSWTGALEYVTDLFDRSTALRLLGHFSRVVESLGRDPRQRLSEIDPAGAAERHQLVREWNDTAYAAPADFCLHELVSAQARRTPEAVAAVLEGESLTYEELDRRTTALALHLLDLGVRLEDRVGVLVDRSLEMIVGLLGILKAGAAYVPLDTGYPAQRLALLIENAGVPAVLAQARWLPLLPGRGERIVVLDEPLPASSSSPASLPALTGRNLAYTLYTSGSTGTPKGVMIPHQGIVNRLLWMQEACELTARDRILQKTPFSFDVSLWELFNPLLVGARLVFARPEGHKDPAYLADLMVREGITAVHFVPSMLQVFLEERDLPAMPALRQVMASGEALPPDLVRRFYDRISGVRLRNLYGPTEASVEVSSWACEPQDSRVPIGRPIRNLGLYVADRQVHPQPLGVPGELLLGGIGLARGYLGRPDLTAAAFVPSPFGDDPGARLYRTGDLARMLPDGAVEYLGRIDHQVKIRGVRIEPGEIEALLSGLPGIGAAAVVVPPAPAASRRLVAFVVPQPGAAVDPAELRRQLQGQVPEALVPSSWVVLDALPLTSNGKVDRRALVRLAEASEPAPGRAPAVLPRNRTEQVLAEIWSELLGRAGVGVLDDFFNLGGHSLLATRVMSRIRQAFGVDLPLRQIFQSPTVAGLAARIEAEGATGHAEPPPLLAVPREGDLPLSFAQERLWFLGQLEPGSPAYNIPAAVRLTGDLGEAVLECCLEEVVRRHEALRTTFEAVEGQPVQRIAPPGSWNLPVVDLSELADVPRDAEARRLAWAESLRPFDLTRGPLVRALLLRESSRRRALLLTLHHIVSDGWSMGVLVGEIAALYPALACGEGSPLPELPVQYADFAMWQRGWLAGAVLERQSVFWRQSLAGAPEALELPTDRPRPATQSFRGDRVDFEIPANRAAALRGLARAESATPFMVLSAAFAALLGRWSGQEEVVLGTPVANRTRPEIEGLIGFFVNTLALRHDLRGDPSFVELLGRVRVVALDAFAHQDLPFEKVVEEVQPRRDPSRQPLFQALLVLQNTPASWPDLPEVGVEAMAVEASSAKFDLTLTLAEDANGSFVGSLEYAADLFEGPTPRRLLDHLGRALESVALDPYRRLSGLLLPAEVERHQLLREWNDTGSAIPEHVCLHDLVSAQARRTPNAVAAVFEGESLTYWELERRATFLARHLVGLGVAVDGRVGVLLERSLEMIVGLLGVLKAGAAYVPLDPSHPAERLALLIESAGVSVVLAQKRLVPLLPGQGERAVVLDEPLPEISSPSSQPVLAGQNLAYTLFTSGSTGKPKGVMIPHQGIVNRLEWMHQAYGLTAADRVLQKTPFSFDVSLWEFFWPLITGARLVFARPEGHKDPVYLADLMVREGITTLHFVPSMLQVFLEEPDLPPFPALRQVMASGEALPPDLVRRFYARIPEGALLHNLYGPTEASVDVSFWACDPQSSRVPIGRPIRNLGLYVADRQLRLQPLGVPGELLLGGVGLARGYLGRPDLTATAFVPDPFGEESGARLYRTGDLARTLPDGAVEYLGRIDHQVKIRGVRIEPGEIESLLSGFPGVAAAAVVVPPAPPDARRLVACVVPQPGTPADLASLRNWLQGQVPEAMVPSLWIVLDALPLTSNGKVDRQALIQLAEERKAARGNPAAVSPRTQTERILAGIWSEVLGRDGIGVFDNFFEVGGHSLLATRVMSRIRQAFGVDLPLRQLFQAPTVAGLAARVEAEQASGKRAELPPLLPAGREGRLPLSFAQERLWFLDRLIPDSPAYHIPLALRFTGALDLGLLEAVLQALIARHESLRTTFHLEEDTGQPYQLVGPVPKSPPALPVLDLSTLPDPEAEARREAVAEALRPFDLRRGPLLRWLLLRLGPDDHAVVFTIHHIISDGWSMGVLTAEVGTLYQGLAAGQPDPEGLLAPLPVQYGDFAVWQRAWLHGEVLESQLRYWRERLTGVPALRLPTDRPRTAQVTGRGGNRPVLVPAATAAGIAALARRSGATLFMVLLAVWKALLHRYTGESDLAVGSPIANRTRLEVEGLIGFFVNTLVLRTDLSGDPPFPEVVGRVRQGTLGAFAHQDLPFERLVEALAPERDLASTPLFQVMFVLQNAPAQELDLPGLALAAFPLEAATSAFDLTLAVTESGGGLEGGLEYSSDLFDAVTVDRLVGHFSALLAAGVARPEQPLSEIAFLAEAERHQITFEWGLARPDGHAAEIALHELFEIQAARRPEATALLWPAPGEGDGLAQLSYSSLDAWSDRLAARLLALGVGPEVPVAVLAGSSPELVAAMLAVWKAGGVYLPLDPAYPVDRLAFLLEDSGARVVLVQDGKEERLPEAVGALAVLRLEDGHAAGLPADRRSRSVPGSLAWIIYTSGSTGRPKGVGVGLGEAVRHLRTAVEVWGFGPGDRMLQFASPSFDAWLEEVVAPLIAGAAVVLRGEEMWEPARTSTLLARTEVTVADLPAAFWHSWVQEAQAAEISHLSRLRLLGAGGEALSAEAARLWFASPLGRIPLLNVYGPTETVISVTLSGVVRPRTGDVSIPIGRPLAGRTARVLDRNGREVPAGVPGELGVGGILARGYLRCPDLTAERFVPDPFSVEPGARLYRSGDLVRLLADGRLDFVGRADHQVKLRGFRIELEEIEAALESHPEVLAAAVLAREAAPGDLRLVAYVAGMEGGGGEPERLRDFLGTHLPAYMLPAAFVFLPALPLTPNGKVDRKALAVLAVASDPAATVGTAPRNPFEEMVLEVWREVLGTDAVGIHDDFFILGGHSLLATRVLSRLRSLLGVDLPLRAFFEQPTAADLAARIQETLAETAGTSAPPLVSVPRDRDLPLSFPQSRLWFLHLLAPDSAAYNMPAALRLRGEIHLGALEAVLREVTARHESLRTTFELGPQGEARQRIHPEPMEFLPQADLSALPEEVRSAEARRLAMAEAGRPFDLRVGPVLRVTLLRLGVGDHTLLVTMHHIVSDGWSIGVLVNEIAALYPAFAAGRPSPLPPLPLQYADFAVWQRDWLRGEALETVLGYWRERLAGAPPALPLPLDRPRPPVASGQGDVRGLRLTAERTASLAALGRKAGATPFMVLLAGWAALLGRLTHEADVLVGTPIANRTRTELEALIGFFVNTLVLRTGLGGRPGFRDLIGRVRESALGAFTHQDMPFERLVEELAPERSLGQTPLFQVLFAFQNGPEGSLNFSGVVLEPLESEDATARFDLSLNFWDEGPALAGSLIFNRDVFDTTTTARLVEHLDFLLESAVAEPDRPFDELPLLPEAARAQLLREWNDTAGTLPELSPFDLFARQAERTPEALAVESEEGSWTYRELLEHSLAWADRLASTGVGPEVRVGIRLDRTLERVAVLLGTFAAGGAYVPLDPEYPEDRLAYLIEDSGLSLLIGPAPLLTSPLSQPPPPRREGPLRPAVEPESLAAVLYTSGSTGRPKGVMLTRGALVNRLLWSQRAYPLGPGDRVFHTASFNFDFALWEHLGPLMAGAAIVLARPGGHRDPGYLAQAIRERGITVAHFVPSMLRAFLEEESAGDCDSLRLVLAGGEALTPDLENLFFARLRRPELRNQYGPTETTIDSTQWLCEPGGGRSGVPIGRPVDNTSVYLLSPEGLPVPLGAVGEVAIGGVGLARGYLGRPDLTAERFLPDPQGSAGARLYRTGDLGRYRPDGALELAGRADFQVKIRGFRVEPEEVEAALQALPGVSTAAVVVQGEAAGRRLLACVVSEAGTELDAATLREELRRRLPDYMFPAVWAVLPELPLSPNGKVDRQALSRLESQAPATASTAPRTAAEKMVAALWADVLGLDRVGPEDDFFALGGHSLIATRVISRVRDAFGIDLPLRTLFEEPTVAGFAAAIERAARSGDLPPAPPIVPVPRTDDLPLSFAQQRLWFLAQLEPDSPAYNVPTALRLSGDLDRAVLAASLGEIVARHEALRTTFEAPANGDPVQRIHPPSPVAIPAIDLAGLPEDRREAEARRLATEEALRPFDLVRGPLLRCHLLRLDGAEHVALFTIHHIVSDAWSTGVLVRELAALYSAFREGRPSPLVPPPIQYADFAAWQRAWLSGEALEAQLRYWRERLAGAPPVLELPADRPRPAVSSGLGGIRTSVLSPRLAEPIREWARRAGATEFMALLAAWDLLLRRLTGSADLLVGTPVANRGRTELEGLLGFFVNTLVLRTEVPAELSFRELTRRVRDGALSAYAYQDLPFERLVEELTPERSLAHSPLFQVMFVLHADSGAGGEVLELPELTLAPFEAQATTSKFDLTLFLSPLPDLFVARMEYSSDLFDATTVDRWLRTYEVLLAAALAERDRALGELPLLAAEERQQLLVEWNDSPSVRELAPVHVWFSEQAARTPERIAVLGNEADGAAMTYGEVERRSDELARRLVELGVGTDVPVGVFLERGWEMDVAMLAVLKAGGCHLPLDPQYPAERLAFMLADSGAPLVVTQERLVAAMPPFSGEAVLLEKQVGLASLPPGPPSLDALAYIVYTSGSTGKPKGVAVQHRVLSNLIAWQLTDSVLPAGSRTLQFASPSFDASVHEVFATWLAGGTLVVADAEHRRDPETLLDWLRETGVERMFLPYVALQQLAEVALRRPGGPTALGLRHKEVQSAGEQLRITPEIAAFFEALPGCVLHDHYGPSETHVVTSWTLSGPPESWPALPPIGRPLAETSLYVLDAQGQPVPAGVPGELFLGGVMVGRGYLGRPDLTAERFLPDPYGAPGSRVYRTGDLVRLGASGEAEFLGRIDYQVKIRGFRVEPGEIEAVLGTHPALREAVVVARGEAAARRLIAYVLTVAEAAPDLPDELGRYLRERMPDYMVPAAFVPLDSLPLTPSGKVDRLTLSRSGPEPGARRKAGEDGARTPTEELLAGIWAEVLGIEPSAGDDFFELGGHSLLATRVASRIRTAFAIELPLRALFEAPKLRALAGRVDAMLRQGTDRPLPPLTRADRGAPLPLSFAQERLWYFDQLEPGSAAYNLPSAFRVHGELIPEAFEAALREIVCRHGVLRTHFSVEAGRPVQIVAPEPTLSLPRIDLLALPEVTRQTELARLAREEAARPFDLARGPLVRAALVHLDVAEQALLFTLHHVVSDGWSFDVLTREIATLYSAFVEGQPSPLPPLPVQYADYAAWQRSWLSGDVLAAEVAHWQDALAGAPLVLELPADRPRPAVESHHGATLDFAFPADLAAAVRRLARQEGATLFMTLLAGFGALLSRWTGQRDLLVGSPVAGRTRQEIEPLIGFFVNTLVLRVDLTGEPDFHALLRRVRETALAAYTHQDLPFERLVEELAPERDLSRNPVYQILFALENAPSLSALGDPGSGPLLQPLDLAGETAKNDLTLILHETADGLAGSVSYATDLFDAATVRRLIAHFEILLRGAAAVPQEPVARLALLSAAEWQQAVHEWNDTLPASEEDHAPLYERFERQVARTPDATALWHGGRALSYRALARQARVLGRRLRDLGVVPGTYVGLCADRSPELLAGLLGIVAAGGAYVPLDPDAPRERLAFVLDETRAPVILSQQRWRDRLPQGTARVLVLEEAASEEDGGPLVSGAPPESPAYVIYTSGSTGRPKGVVIPQHAVVRLARDSRCLQLRPDDRIGFASTPVFDASTFEVWGALLNGASLVTLDKDTVLSPAALAGRLAEDGVTALFLTTAVFQQSARERPEMFAPLRTLLFGGEACDPRLVAKVAAIRPPRRLLHVYGPTETTTFSTWHPVASGDESRGTIPIGLPLDDRTVQVLDPAGAPVPIGVAGELYVGGHCAAWGYLERPDLTAERFLPDPFCAGGHPGGRLYRTGDLVRRRVDGAVEFLGRVDFQVKVRGFRIELEEIEAVLRSHANVVEAVVRLTEGEDKRLVAHVVPRSEAPTAAELREHLRRTLPEFMVPGGFAFLSSLPLNAQGKVDRAALARTTFEEEAVETADYVAPRTPAEELLAGIWAEALGVGRVGANDNFFDLSGHSLLATRVVHQVRAAFGVELPLRSLFERATLADLAREIEARERGGESSIADLPSIERVPRGGRLLAAPYQRLLVLAQGGLVSSMYNMPFGMHLQGRLDLPALFQAYAELLRRHESLRTTLHWQDGDLVQEIAEPGDAPLPVVDLAGLPAGRRQEEAVALSLDEQARPLDISRTILRTYLVLLSREEHVLVVNIHHSMSDGWSLEVLREDLTALYSALARQQAPALPPLPVQYADYAAWARKAFQGESLESRLAYWRERLEGRPPGLHLPVPRPRPERVASRVQVVDLDVEGEDLARLRALVRERGATLPIVLFTTLHLLFHRYTGHEDIVLGSASSMRDRAELTGLIGLIMNVIPVRIRFAGATTFGDLLARVRSEVLGAYSHAVPLPELSAALCPGQPPSRTLFHNMVFNMGSFRASTSRNRPQDGAHDLEVDRLTFWEGEAKYDLTVQCFEQEDNLFASFIVPVNLITEGELESLRDDYRELLLGAVARPEAPLPELLPVPRYRPGGMSSEA